MCKQLRNESRKGIPMTEEKKSKRNVAKYHITYMGGNGQEVVRQTFNHKSEMLDLLETLKDNGNAVYSVVHGKLLSITTKVDVEEVSHD